MILAESFTSPVVVVEPEVCESVAEVITEGVDDKNVLRCVVVIGSGGSGKSTIAKEMFAGRGMKLIDADRHFERMLKMADEPLSHAGMRGDLFTKARDLRNRELTQYANRRIGLVIDATGWDYERVARPYLALKKLGYDLFLVYVEVSEGTALNRNAERAYQGGRAVPDYGVSDAWRGVTRNFEKYVQLFRPNNVMVVKNDANVKPLKWKTKIAPALFKIGGSILAKPLTNPIGIAWLKSEKRKQTLNTKPKIKPEQIEMNPTRKPIVKLDGTTVVESLVDDVMLLAGSNIRAAADLFEDRISGRGYEVLVETGGETNHEAVKMLVKFILHDPRMRQEYLTTCVRAIALWRKQNRYDASQADNLPKHLVTHAGKVYHRRFNKGGGEWHSVFNEQTRAAIQKKIRRHAEKDAARGLVRALLPKKYQGAGA